MQVLLRKDPLRRFLGTLDSIQMDPARVVVVVDWAGPTCFRDI